MENRTLTIGGMAYDSDGYLWVATDAGIQVCDQNGRVRAILRLPLDIEKAIIDSRSGASLRGCRLDILPGTLRLTTPAATYTRALNIAPPTGVPESQGQG